MMATTEAQKPVEGQKWTHRQMGGELIVTEVSTSHVKLVRADGRGRINMMIEQLHEHYKPLS